MTKSGDSDSGIDQAVRTVPKDPDPDLSPKAVAARVGDRELWIGNVGAIKPRLLAEMELDPEYVVSVNGTATDVTTDHHPLQDGSINDPEQFANAVAATRTHIRDPGTVLVNCSVGVSRSTTVVATAISAEEGLSFDVAVAAIEANRPRARPHPKLRLNAYAYLATIENRPDARRQFEELVDEKHLEGRNVEALEAMVAMGSTDRTPS